MSTDSRVSITRIDGRLGTSVRRAVNLLGDPDAILPAEGDVVLVKPNVGWHNPWQTGTVTNPDFVKEIIQLVRERHPSRIIVGESPSIGMVGEEVFRKTGYDRLRGEDVEVRDLGRDETVEVPVPGNSQLKKVALPATYLSADYFINVPVVKTHVNTCVTLSMKNLKGLLPRSEKKRFHFTGLDRSIAELASVVRNDLILVDGEIGQEGLGPLSGSPVGLGAVLAGTNPLAVDTTCIRAMGVPFSRVKHLEIALEMGLGPRLEELELVGDPVESVAHQFELPPPDLARAYKGVNIIQGNPCSGCIGALTVSLERMASAGELESLENRAGMVNIVVGPEARPPDAPAGHWVIVGKCLRRYAENGKYVPGCSPQGWYVRDVLRSIIGLPPLFVDEGFSDGLGVNGEPRGGE